MSNLEINNKDNFNAYAHTVNSTLFGGFTSKDLEIKTLEDWKYFFPEIIGQSTQMLNTLNTVCKIAKSNSAVLIYGESGTGKELIANAIHRLSLRADKRFVAINCSAIPESLLESELFGYEKGAFTGAVGKRSGLFEIADGGSVFLDEIGEMPSNLQAKLLRVLQEKKFIPIGGRALKSIDIRIIAATNIKLEEAISAGKFRLDLFYRLNVLPINIPPLRERKEDILLLLEHYLKHANIVHNVSNPCYFSDEVVEILYNYSWPGNVRELQNLVERLVLLSGGGQILVKHLPKEFISYNSDYNTQISDSVVSTKTYSNGANEGGFTTVVTDHENIRFSDDFSRFINQGISLTDYIENLENQIILYTLKKTNYNKNQAAKLLGINRTTLVEKIKKRKLLTHNTDPHSSS